MPIFLTVITRAWLWARGGKCPLRLCSFLWVKVCIIRGRVLTCCWVACLFTIGTFPVRVTWSVMVQDVAKSGVLRCRQLVPNRLKKVSVLVLFVGLVCVVMVWRWGVRQVSWLVGLILLTRPS